MPVRATRRSRKSRSPRRCLEGILVLEISVWPWLTPGRKDALQGNDVVERQIRLSVLVRYVAADGGHRIACQEYVPRGPIQLLRGTARYRDREVALGRITCRGRAIRRGNVVAMGR